MDESKYGKYILRNSGEKRLHPDEPGVTTADEGGMPDWNGVQHRLNWKYITQPVFLEDEPHFHDFDEFLCFMGCDPLKALDFGAEAELILGREKEQHIINYSSVTFIPKGLVHGPLRILKVSQPILFGHIYLAPEYVAKPAST